MNYFTAEVRNALAAKFGETVTAAQLAFEVERAAYVAALKGELIKISRGVFGLSGSACAVVKVAAPKPAPGAKRRSYEDLGSYVAEMRRLGSKVEDFTGAFAWVDGIRVGMINGQIVNCPATTR